MLSEKPIAKDSTVAKQLIAEYEPYKSKGLVWSVAENFRFLKPITFGAEQLRRIGGGVTSFQISIHNLIKEGNPYFATEWYNCQADCVIFDLICTNAQSGARNQIIKEASSLMVECISSLVCENSYPH